MQVGDMVQPKGLVGGKAGLVRMVEGRKVAVRWVLGSGWYHTAIYDLDELEVKS